MLKNLTLTEIAGRLGLSGENYPIKYWQGANIIKPTSFLNVDDKGVGRFIEIYPQGRDHKYAILPIDKGIADVKYDELIGSYKITSTRNNVYNRISKYTVAQGDYTVDFYLLQKDKISKKDIKVILESVSPLLKAIGKGID